jgi:phenylpropionate dioxygenase-like ring-hydroxylating dioxygenase large terminal subunit
MNPEKSANWLRNRWYQAGWADEVTAETPLVRTLLNEPILFYRKADGNIAALFDRCPHRFAPLSAGTIDGDTVTCGYHGLGFASSGACVTNPHGPITSNMRVTAYPVAERHTALWIWMGDPALADAAHIPDLSFIDETPEAARIQMYMPTQANYQLITDNILDLSHADYLHPTSLGGIIVGARATTREEGDTVVAEWNSQDCVPPPAFVAMVAPAERADIWTEVVWQAPALMILGTAAKPTGVPRTATDESYTLHNMVPETETSTHYFACSTRRFLIDDADFSTFLKSTLEHAFVHEDKPMLEKQQARMGTPDLWALDPILLKVDAAAVRARRKLDALIVAERGEVDVGLAT